MQVRIINDLTYTRQLKYGLLMESNTIAGPSLGEERHLNIYMTPDTSLAIAIL